MLQSVGQHRRVHIHIFIFACGAGSAIGNLDGNRRVQLANKFPVAGVAGCGNHGRNLVSIQLDDLGVLSIGIAVQALEHGFGFLAIDAAAFCQKFHYFGVGRDNAGEASDFGGHIGHGGALVHAERLDGFAGIFHHLGQRFTAANIIEAQNLENEILRCHIGMPAPANDDFDRFRHADPHVFSNPAIENVSRANAEGDASYSADVRRM